MTRKSVAAATPVRPFSAVIVFLAGIVILLALTAQAQQGGAAQASGDSQAADCKPATAVATENPKIAATPRPHVAGVTTGQPAMPTVSFLPVVSYYSPNDIPYSLVIADVNNDGHPDVITSNLDGTVGVMLGNGDGTLQPEVTYPSGGSFAVSVAVADLNHDGKLDLVVANYGGETNGDGSVAVLLGNGGGTFQTPVNYDPGWKYNGKVVVADLTGSGNLDIVVVNQTGNGVSDIGIFFGNGTGKFQPAVKYSSGTSYAYSVAVSDLRGNGNLDIVTAAWLSQAVSILLGNGDGTFQPAVIYAAGDYPLSVATADVNGDGKPDLELAESTTPGAVGILIGNGDGTFQPVITYPSGGIAVDNVAVADLNGDSKPDLVVSNCGVSGGCGDGVSGQVAVLLGNGDGTFQSPVTFLSGGDWLTSLAVADLNNDGKPDVVTTNYYSYVQNTSPGVIGVLLNDTSTTTCTGQCPTSTTLTSSLNPSIYGQKVVFTATVTPTGSIPPTGKVVFSWSGYVLDTATLDSSGVATFTISDLNADPYPMVATYKGDANNLSSTSAIVNQVVNQTTSSATITSSPNPSSVGEAVTFTAKITSPTVTAKGPVTFTAGKTVLGTVELSGGKATLTTSSLPAGSSMVTVTYQGDSNIKGSSASVTQVVGESEISTTTTLAYSVNNSTLMETFTAEVTSSGGTPTGTVSFSVGNMTLGSSQLDNGQATLTVPTLSVGSNTVDANYEGNSEFEASSAWITQTFVMPVTGTLYLQQEGGSASATTSFGTGTSASNLVFYYSGLPNNPNPTGEVTLGTYTAGTLVNFGMYTVFGSESGYAFSIGTDEASLVAFADLSNSLGMNHGVTQQTSSTTWLLHLDDALSYLYDDDNNDVLMELIVVPQ